MQKVSDLYREGGRDEAALPLIGMTWGAGGQTVSARAMDFQNSAALSAGAGVWQTILDVAGAGLLRGLGMNCSSIGASPAYIELRVTLDGVEQARAQVGSTTNAGYVGLPTVFGISETQGFTSPVWGFRFNDSLKIEARRSGSQSVTVHYTHSMDRSQ